MSSSTIAETILPGVSTDAVLNALNRILEAELAGVVRYTHYSFMVFGPHRMPIVSWLRQQANESMVHSHQVGELITQLGGHPSLAIGPLLETHKHELKNILQECLDHEQHALGLYRDLLALVKDKSVLLEEYARTQLSAEETHMGELHKMLRGL